MIVSALVFELSKIKIVARFHLTLVTIALINTYLAKCYTT